MKAGREPKIVYKIMPCPQYDVSGMECWLSEMAEQGMILQQDGIFCGIVTFEKTVPQIIKYRLQAAEKSTSMWADNNGEPDAEEVELSKKFGWEYVAKRGEFHIYCTSNPDARELHTDKEVQALAMNAMKKRQWDSIFNSIFWDFSILYYCYENYIPLADYKGDMPFKTMEDFVTDGKMQLMNMKVGNLNTVREWSDILSPVNRVDDTAAYTTSLHFPCVILKNGNKILYARFYTSGKETIKFELSEWAGFLAESLLKDE